MKDVRLLEKQIDAYPSSLPICKRHLSQVLWHLLLAHEHELQFRTKEYTSASYLHNADELKKGLKHAFEWAHKYCKNSDSYFAPEFSLEIYSEARDLLILGSAYQPFYSMCSILNNKRKLVLAYVDDNGTLHMEYDSDQLQYEALHWISAELIANTRLADNPPKEDIVHRYREAMLNVIKNSDLLSVGQIKVNIRQPEYDAAKSLVQHAVQGSYQLPNNWSFRGVTIDQFRQVLLSILTLSSIDSFVHGEFVNMSRNPNKGFTVFDTFVWTGSITDLVRRISNYEPILNNAIVKSVLSLLIYNRKLNKPDPALQPIIPFGDMLMIPPQLMVSSSLERNLVSLLAREYKSEYDKTSDVLAPQLLDELYAAFSKRHCVVSTAIRIPGRKDLGDIDLLVFDPCLRILIIAEVKWVIPPGEPYEQLTRADTEERAITNQLVPLMDFAKENTQSILALLNQPERQVTDIEISGVLLMRGFCGMKHELSHVYPTIDADLLLQEMRYSKSNKELFDWMKYREFMPELGKDYKVQDISIKLGPYSIVINACSSKI